MKTKFGGSHIVLVILAISSGAHAATITWANTNGGDWNIATNWSPAQVPGSGDNVLITTNGTYTVTNSMSVTLGNLTLGGTNGIQTLTLASLTLTNIGLVSSNGVFNWDGGEVDGGLTVAPGGALNITNNTTYYIQGSLTNNGTVNWSAGSIYGYGPPSYTGLIYNAGLWNAEFDGSLNLASGTPAFINAGTFRKSGGTGITYIYWNFTSTGTLDIQTGSLSTSAWVGNNILNGDYNGTISVNSNATVTVPAGVTVNWTGGTVEAGGVFNVSSNGVVNWAGGEVDGGLMVAPGGVLNLTNNTTYTIYGTVTNSGTVNWSAGSIYGYGPPSYNGLIYNAGLWNAEFDGTLTIAGGTPAFINPGIFRKSGGTGVTTIGWNFTSTGIFDTQTGSLSCSTWVGNSILNGNYTGSATLNSGATLTVATNAQLNWTGGEVDGGLTVAPGGALNITNNTTYYIQGSLTNNGTVNWSAGSIYGYGPPSYTGLIYNAGLWNAEFDGSLNLASGTPAFINAGTFRKSGGTGITYIYWNFTNRFGILDAQTNTLSLAGNYDLTGGTLNFGLTSPTNYGTINLAGAAPLTGTVSANLNNGYIPIAGNSFTNLYYGSFTGEFTNTVLPFTDAWTTNYFPTYYVMTALNSRPILAALTTNKFTVNELATLNVTNSATDLDIPAQTLTYSLVAGTSGMTVNSSSGVFTWTPQQTNSPSTNLVSVAVTDSGAPPLSATNTFTVIVKEVNVPPTLPTISTQIVNEITLLTVTNLATNANIHSIITGYALVSPLAGMAISTNGIFTWTPAQTQSPGTNLVTTIVTNSNPFDLINPQLKATNTFTVIVKEVNVPASLPTISTQMVNELTLLTVTNTATNANIHATITGYALVNPPTNMVISASGIITWTPAQAQSPGTNLITTVVTNLDAFDLVHSNLTSTNTFTVIVKEVNVPAALPTISTQMVNELTLLTVTNTATNANIHAMITGYALINPPTNMVISASGTITWTPAQAQSPGTNLITTVVTNSDVFDLVNPTLTSTNTFTVIVKEVNVPASLPTISTQMVNELTLLTVTNTATNANIHATITGYALVNPPTNMVISASGIITWTPAQAQSPGTNLITTVVTNLDAFDLVHSNLTSTNTFTVIVKEVNVAPVLQPISTQTVTLLTLFSITNSATEPNIHSTTGNYQLLVAPAGAAINSSGVITWTPAPTQTLTTNTVTTVVTNSNPYDLVNPHLGSTNSFSVIVAPNTVATNLTMLNAGGTNLTLNWPPDHTGWRLEIQTNTIATGISTNWVAITGSVTTNQVVVPITQTNGAVFFRMIYP